MENRMMLTVEKLRRRIEELEPYRYRYSISISKWNITEDNGDIGSYPPVNPADDYIQLGERWRGRDVYVWLTQWVEIPESWSGKRILMLLDLGTTGGGNNSGFESLFFLNQHPYQGVDTNHKEVFLPDVTDRDLRVDVRLWSGLGGGGTSSEREHILKQSSMCCLDDATDDLYFTAVAALQTIEWLEDSSPDGVQLLSILDGSFRLIDWSHPGNPTFYASVVEARSRLQTGLDGMTSTNGVTAVCVGHTHIDVAWLWRLRHTREKSARSFSTVLRLMELFPEFYFLQSQPQLYSYIRRDYPEIYENMRERIAEGRWEAGGAMWLEADCNIPSGESLVRHILFGTRFLKREFGVECTYLWLPDVFGYTWALPQILRKSGIDTFMTTKISWNQYNRMPHDTFRWRGMDGSEVLAHFITTPEPDSKGGWFYTYNGQLEATTVGGAWKAYQDKHVNKKLLIAYGYGDGGGGVTRDMLEMRRRLNAMPGLPKVVTGRADDYFRELQATVARASGYVHTWDGELYLEYHRGTYTSQAFNKKMNRKLELAYRDAEWLNALMGTFFNGWDARAWQERLNQGWEIVLRNQFHDIIPGSSIREVYEDSRQEYAEALDIKHELDKALTSCVAAEDEVSSWLVWNSSNWVRSGIVKISTSGLPDALEWEDTYGHSLKAQLVNCEWWIAVKKIPALGWVSIRARAAQATDNEKQTPFSIGDHAISTPYYQLEWNEDGQWTRLYDVHSKREILGSGQKANVLQVFEDKPLAHDAWDIDIFYQDKMDEIRHLEQADTVTVGETAAVINFRWSYGVSIVNQQVVLYADNPRIDCVTRVDWQERQKLLKVAFPVHVRCVEATYDIQFGTVRRPTHWNTSWDWARFESVGHQWADLSESTHGVALANNCKYGYDIKDNVIRLSLLKSAKSPDPEADRGEHEFTYSLIPHEKGWLDSGVVQLAWDLNSPLFATEGEMEDACGSLFNPFDDNVIVDALKLAEDENRILLRFHDFAGGRRRMRLETNIPIRSWQECDLLERPNGNFQQGAIELEIGPYEIKSLLIEVEDSVKIKG